MSLEEQGVKLSNGQIVNAIAVVDGNGNQVVTFPTTSPDMLSNGAITTKNLNATGAGTAGSYVGLSGMSSMSTLSIHVIGTYTGALTPQASLDGVNWVTLGGVPLIQMSTGGYSATITSGSTGIYCTDVSSFAYFRLVALAAVTGSATVYLQVAEAAALSSLDNPLPPGSNIIGGTSDNITQVNGGTIASNTAPTGSTKTLAVSIPAPSANVDMSSQTITTSGSTGIIADDFGDSIAGIVNVSAVSGTLPTLDVILQESFDNGVTWQDIYHVERLTAIGTAAIPHIQMGGRRQWKYTLGGTTPSFTFSIICSRNSGSPLLVRKFFDRSLVSSQSLNATTGVYLTAGIKNVTMIVSSGAAATPCAIIMQLSADGINFFNVNSPIGSSANNTVAIANSTNIQGKYARGLVTTAGVTQTLNYVSFFGTN